MTKVRTLRTEHARYDLADWDGKSTGHFQPIGDTVQVKIDAAAKTAGREGSILLPETKRDQLDGAVQTGIIVAMGEGAFYWTADRTRQWEGQRPKVGDRVFFRLYAGSATPFIWDEVKYRMMTDADIFAIVHTPSNQDAQT